MPPFVSMTCWTTCTRNKRSLKKKNLQFFFLLLFLCSSAIWESGTSHQKLILLPCTSSEHLNAVSKVHAQSDIRIQKQEVQEQSNNYKVKDSGCWLVSAHLTEERNSQGGAGGDPILICQEPQSYQVYPYSATYSNLCLNAVTCSVWCLLMIFCRQKTENTQETFQGKVTDDTKTVNHWSSLTKRQEYSI